MSESIESKIRSLREAANLSIEELAKALGISEQQMEQIENGSVHPNISTLMKVARTLGVRLGTLLDGTEIVGPIVNTAEKSSPVTRIAESEECKDHMNFFSLAENKSDRNMEPLIIEVDYMDDSQEFSKHEGEEFIYVLDGSITIKYGTEVHNLSKGDSIYYDSIVPHLVSSTAKGQTAKILAVTYTPY